MIPLYKDDKFREVQVQIFGHTQTASTRQMNSATSVSVSQTRKKRGDKNKIAGDLTLISVRLRMRCFENQKEIPD